MKVKTKVTTKGSLNDYVKRVREFGKSEEIKALAEQGLFSLSQATPVDTGKTAGSWSYKLKNTPKGFRIDYFNSNMSDGVPVVILLQYGHATIFGKYYEGTDFINPAIDAVFDDLVVKLNKEVSE